MCAKIYSGLFAGKPRLKASEKMFVVIFGEKKTSGVYVAFENGIPSGFSGYDFFEIADCSPDCAEEFAASEKKYDDVYPPQRAEEIEKTGSEKVRQEKLAVWKLLLVAIERKFGYKPEELKFSKTENGKWICDKLWFSLSHSHGASAVIVSDKPCGIDVEYKVDFLKKSADKSFIEGFLNRMGESASDFGTISAEEILSLWTKKESLYKMTGEGVFSPKKITPGNETKSFVVGDYVFSVTE